VRPTTLSAPDSVLVNLADVGKMLGVHQSTIMRWVETGKFPEPLRFSSQTIRWRRKDIETMLTNMQKKQTARNL
jgi:predicted DNA-binding transcriptional regulator AlpA